jgi:hypothetical protein
VIVPADGVTVHVTAVPVGKFSTENCWVPAGATVAVAGLTLVAGLKLAGDGTEAFSVKVALPRKAYPTVLAAIRLTAKIVTVCWEGTLLGAVKTPAGEMVPTGETPHSTLVPEGKFSTANCLVPPGATVAVAGVTLIGSSVKLAVPRMACVTAFDAVTAIVCSDSMLFGAV